MIKKKLLSLLLVVSAFISACTTTAPDQYYWGKYERLIHDMYVKAGKATPQVQIERITQDIQKAEKKGKPVPPGVYAHLGFMYSLDGNIEAATAAFNEEKSLYKDSAILIDGMLARAQKSAIEK